MRQGASAVLQQCILPNGWPDLTSENLIFRCKHNLKKILDQVLCVSHDDGAESVGGRGGGAVHAVGNPGRRAGGRDQRHVFHAHGGHRRVSCLQLFTPLLLFNPNVSYILNIIYDYRTKILHSQGDEVVSSRADDGHLTEL